MTTEPDPIVVNFPVSLDTELRSRYSQTSDGEYVEHGTYTLLDAIVDSAAGQLVAKVVKDDAAYGQLRTSVKDIRNEMIRERIAPMLDEVFGTPTQLTNVYGERTGKEVTLRELVIETARSQMKRTNARSDYDRTAFDKALSAATVDVLTAELSAEIAEAKKQLREQIHAVSLNAIATAITKQIAPV